MALLRGVYGTALAAWLGIAVYVSGLLLPALGARLPHAFGTITQTVFPGYFRAGEVLAAVALAAALAEWIGSRGRPGAGVALARLALASLVLALLAYAGEVLLPQVHAARGDAARFAALHARSLLLNGLAALASLVGALLAQATSRPAATPRYRS